MLTVGLTGNVAAGKSTVLALFASWGATVIDSDALAREVVAPGSEGLAAVVARFGRAVQRADGALDRAALRRRVMADARERLALEAIVHPLVRQRGRELEAAAPDGALVVHDIPLLAETGQAATFDAVVVVDVPVETQIERMMTLRGMSREEVESRVAAQATREQRLAVATHVIENTGTIEDLRERVTEVFEALTTKAVS